MFPAIRIEGGLLGPDTLDQLLAGELEGQNPGDFGLAGRRTLTDEIAGVFADARAQWQVFQHRRERLPDADQATSVTRDAWMIPFLSFLDYKLFYNTRAYVVDGATFAISHRAGDAEDAPPVHIVGAQQELGRLAPTGRPRLAPHSLVQEYLNRSEQLWGIVTNGLTIRLLRNSTYIRRQAYVEFDLRQILEEQLFPDFSVLYRLLHRSRLPRTANDAGDCLLERYHRHALEQGGRVREGLRDGVEKCLTQLAEGFLAHPKNQKLRAQVLPSGSEPERLPAEELYRQLLHLVYRFLFLLVSEDRGLVSPDPLYREHYGVARLRQLLDRRSAYTDYDDLWCSLQVLWKALSDEKLARCLGATPLNSELFAPIAFDHCTIANRDLLEAFRHLTYYQESQSQPPRRVNYAALDVEELGSVYESLLDHHAQIEEPHEPNNVPRFKLASGSERKSTGSYYTPPELVAELIRSALEPVLEERLKHAKSGEEKAQAILSLRVLDPACGSGHFLLAAARRLGKELAKIRTGEAEPAPERVREAIREVVARCIYGVDKNPLAVELAKVALWIETVEPSKPLTFLNHHIQCGDSLVGVLDPKILAKPIPDEAYKPLTGDDKEICNALKKRNRDAEDRVRQGDLLDREAALRDRALAVSLNDMPEESLADIAAKRERWQRLHQDPHYVREKYRADLFTAAFFAPKTRATAEKVPVTEDLLSLAEEQTSRPGVIAYAAELAAQHRFFHWHLAFPEIMEKGGFDVVLGNPPWERIKLQEQEFFASRSRDIARAANKAARDKLIKDLGRSDARPDEKALLLAFEEAKRGAEAASQFIRTGGRYPLTGTGDVNTYAVFAETFLNLINPHGRAGFIVPTGIATDNSTKAFFEFVSTERRLASLFDFENRKPLFQAVDSRMKFCLLTLGTDIPQADFVFFATNVKQLADSRRRFMLSPEDILRINPNTRTAPVFRSQADAELTKKINARVPVLVDESKGKDGNPWGISFMAMFHMSNDSGRFRSAAQLEATGARREGVNWVEPSGQIWVPLYEAKMIHQFDHRWATYETDGETSRDVTEQEKKREDFEPNPRYWVPQREVEDRLRAKGWTRGWLMGWRDITNATNERTVIAAAVPRVGVNHKIPLFMTAHKPSLAAALPANFSALVLDYVARQKVGGTSLTYFYLKQFPVLPPSAYDQEDLDFIIPRVLELIYTSPAMKPFAKDLGYDGPPFAWDPDRRAWLRAELDAYYARLYGLTRDELRYILDPSDVKGSDYPSETFRVLKDNEIRRYGEYRTARLTLACYDAMQQAERSKRLQTTP
ncbi:MAG: N-6 DNA methylase [Acidobacteriia bacterium]|nr:N-6 DNA methylase [Methyloceanibacter sp.]MCL6490407.1 N-6 DNA methylase [Terriglobia bacterium]